MLTGSLDGDDVDIQLGCLLAGVVYSVGVVVHDIDPDEPVNMSSLLAFE